MLKLKPEFTILFLNNSSFWVIFWLVANNQINTHCSSKWKKKTVGFWLLVGMRNPDIINLMTDRCIKCFLFLFWQPVSRRTWACLQECPWQRATVSSVLSSITALPPDWMRTCGLKCRLASQRFMPYQSRLEWQHLWLSAVSDIIRTECCFHSFRTRMIQI